MSVDFRAGNSTYVERNHLNKSGEGVGRSRAYIFVWIAHATKQRDHQKYHVWKSLDLESVDYIYMKLALKEIAKKSGLTEHQFSGSLAVLDGLGVVHKWKYTFYHE
jgi:hypothetical protein